MKTSKLFGFAAFAALLSFGIASCDDANEYEDYNASNPSWVAGWNDSMSVNHPETLAETSWVRTPGLKLNAYGEDVQGFVESIHFVQFMDGDNVYDSCAVKMSQPEYPLSWQNNNDITWTDDSNTESVPYYNYTYSNVTGRVEVVKYVKNDKGAVSAKTILTGIVTVGTKKTVLTMTHYGDIPAHSYLTQQ